MRSPRATNVFDESIGRVVLSGRLRSPCALRCAPIDAFKQIAELSRRDRHRAVRRRWPDETAAFQALREHAHALPVVPKHFEQAAAPSAKNKKLSAVRIVLQFFLNQERQAVEAP